MLAGGGGGEGRCPWQLLVNTQHTHTHTDTHTHTCERYRRIQHRHPCQINATAASNHTQWHPAHLYLEARVEEETLMKWVRHSPLLPAVATALASIVLPVPGGPNSSRPCGEGGAPSDGGRGWVIRLAAGAGLGLEEAAATQSPALPLPGSGRRRANVLRVWIAEQGCCSWRQPQLKPHQPDCVRCARLDGLQDGDLGEELLHHQGQRHALPQHLLGLLCRHGRHGGLSANRSGHSRLGRGSRQGRGPAAAARAGPGERRQRCRPPRPLRAPLPMMAQP